jgi:uncharacterized protein YbjT (DUF2867 family)
MRIVVVGGTGHVGRKVVERIEQQALAVVVASPATGVDAYTGRGLDRALELADAVIDVTNVRTSAGKGSRDFFLRSTENLLEAEARAGVQHHVLLSIVGSEWDTNGYFSAKRSQEQLVERGPIPHSIVRSTQFFSFARVIAEWNTSADTVRLPAKPVRPVAASDVADLLVEVASSAPSPRALEVGGPEEMPLPEFVNRVLRADNDVRYVVTDGRAVPLGFNISGSILLPHGPFRTGPTSLQEWMDMSARRRPAGAF